MKPTAVFLSLSIATLIAAPLAVPAPACADGGPVPIPVNFGKIQYSGSIRDYYFTRTIRIGSNQRAYSLGGKFHLETSGARGLGAGLSLFTAQPLGLNSGNPALDDKTLPATQITTFGEAYLQYRGQDFLARAGRTLVQTPWAGPSDSRIIPSTFEGLVFNGQLGSVTLSADRLWRFKSRTSGSFDRSTLLTTTGSPGALAFGAAYKQGATSAQAWYYDFYNIASMWYGDATERFKTRALYKPYVGAQYVDETSSTTLLSKPVFATAWGAVAGMASNSLDVSVAYNNLPWRSGFFRNGGIASPYTDSYTTDPLYTTQMFTGLVERGAGHGLKAAATWWSPNRQWRLIASRGEYHLYTMPGTPSAYAAETDVDTTYFFKPSPKTGAFKGLAIRYRLGFQTSTASPYAFTYGREMLEYTF